MLGHEYYDSYTAYLAAGKSGMFSDENKELSGAVVDGIFYTAIPAIMQMSVTCTTLV